MHYEKTKTITVGLFVMSGICAVCQ